jgi:hypothetical protein
MFFLGGYCKEFAFEVQSVCAECVHGGIRLAGKPRMSVARMLAMRGDLSNLFDGGE